MSQSKKTVCLFLSLIILFWTAFSSLSVSAAKLGYVNGTDVRIRSEATTSPSSKILDTVSNVNVEILGEKSGQVAEKDGGDKWYNVKYGDIVGYIYGKYITLYPEYVPDKPFEEQIADFPDSYKSYLRNLHAEYPNWYFIADKIDMTLDEAVELENGEKYVSNSSSVSWRSLDKGAYDWNKGIWEAKDTSWLTASREVTKYYMDPRNFLNRNEIYQFMEQKYNPQTQKEAGIINNIAETFLSKNYSDDNDTEYGGSYSKVLMAAANLSGVSPYILAAKIIQEQGVHGTSSLISGKYPGYEGYYNYFNVQAYGESNDEKIKRGLEYAKNQKWDSRSKSIIGGAKFCADSYINAGQNTYFYMDFNLKNPERIGHQYATAVHDAISKGKGVSNYYKDRKNEKIEFYIPVYKNMPSDITKLPEKNGNLNNYYFNDIIVSGLTPSFERFTYNYTLRISADTKIYVDVPSGAAYVGNPNFSFNAGEIKKIPLTVKSQTGYTTDYYITVMADKACTLNVDLKKDEIIKGDTNGDAKISLIDLANVKKHLLGKVLLTGNGLKGGDTNGDGKISLIDLANIKKHLLGVISLV